MSTFWRRLRERTINLYLPLLGAGIRAVKIDATTTRVELRMTAFNRNIVGTHYGGSLYSMCDPWYMLILMRALGPDYVVWDKAASIQFRRPGRGTVTALFHISPERIEALRAEADRTGKVEPVFGVDVLDRDGQVVAHVDKHLHIRKRAAA